MINFCSSLWLDNTPSCTYATFSLSIQLLTGT
jgi:hypothetical protein